MTSTLTPQELQFARVLKETQSQLGVMDMAGATPKGQGQISSEGVKLALTRMAALLAPEKRVEFVITGGCPEFLVPLLMIEIDYMVESLKVFGTMDPEALIHMASNDPVGYNEKCQHMRVFKNALRAKPAPTQH